ncbi:MAG: ABC transporter permease [Rhodobacteraceae bacterium CG17_big_fil_post_rev_8_21_14_2_50_63_15]|nr:ABC transporter permease [Roseovarius sp.]PIV77184.1 MAG: ABC transporter permease [Rhodobacteraceae bacterium CG17_big_fil_post_rev_8_21_14_2_50_63_15]
MFKTARPRSSLHSAFRITELIYHATVRDLRQGHGNAVIALALNILTAVIMVMAFYLMFTVLGIRGAKLRGDFLLFMMSGIFMYLTHIKALSAVLKAEGPASPMMQHAPMNTVISITAGAIGALYIQVLSMTVILFVYHVSFNPIEIYQPIAAFGMLLLAWFTGVAAGLVLLSIKPWFPTFVSIFSTIYQRANMIASGKMFVVNTLPPFMVKMFDWNPLFHIIDQARGFVFINYFPHKTSLDYPIYVGIALLMVGLMGEFYTRQFASSSWNARR